MSHRLDRLPHKLDRRALTCRAIVETPAGSRIKYKYAADCRVFELGKLLPASLSFPMNFGFIPSTRAADGDPLDILILSEVPLAIGAMARVRLIGALLAEQTQDGETLRNDRLVATLEDVTRYSGVAGLDQLGDSFTGELERFFTTYNELRGRRFKILSQVDASGAADLIEAATL